MGWGNLPRPEVYATDIAELVIEEPSRRNRE